MSLSLMSSGASDPTRPQSGPWVSVRRRQTPRVREETPDIPKLPRIREDSGGLGERLPILQDGEPLPILTSPEDRGGATGPRSKSNGTPSRSGGRAVLLTVPKRRESARTQHGESESR
jgi:hypothetical protein